MILSRLTAQGKLFGWAESGPYSFHPAKLEVCFKGVVLGFFFILKTVFYSDCRIVWTLFFQGYNMLKELVENFLMNPAFLKNVTKPFFILLHMCGFRGSKPNTSTVYPNSAVTFPSWKQRLRRGRRWGCSEFLQLVASFVFLACFVLNCITVLVHTFWSSSWTIIDYMEFLSILNHLFTLLQLAINPLDVPHWIERDVRHCSDERCGVYKEHVVQKSESDDSFFLPFPLFLDLAYRLW